jgi:predicted XRE-type DNA-binding protein
MRLRIGKDGYPRVTLQDGAGNKVVERVHLLVAEEFLGPARGRIVRHLDGRRDNPRLQNLEYGTMQENSDDKYFHGTAQVGEQNSQALLTEKEVREIRRMYKQRRGGRRCYTQKEIGERFKISRQAVSDIVRGKTWI